MFLKTIVSTAAGGAATLKTPICGKGCMPLPAKSQPVGLGAQISDFFSKIFNTADWPPRWHCGTWTDFHGWLYIASDVMIWASYFAIPVFLIRMLTKRTDIPFPKIIWLFVAFIVLCGTTHLIDAIIFWWPAYRLSALIRFFTAVVSAVAVYALYRVMPLILSLRSIKELEREINERKLVEEKLAASEFLLKEAGRLGRMGGWEYDPLTKKSIWSATVYDIYEVSKDFDIDRADPFSYFEEPYRQKLKKEVALAFENGTGWDIELQMRTANNNLIWVRSCGEAFYNTDRSTVTKLQGVLMDIDRYKKTERELNRSHEMLSQSHQQLKTFTHILSHNIRNHSSNISLLTSLVEPEVLDESNAELFDKITKVSRNLSHTLDDLAQAIRIRETYIAPELVSFDNILDKVLEVLEPEIKGTDAKVNLNFNVDSVLFPRLYLESILLNLLSNAIKYRNEHKVPNINLSTFNDPEGRVVLECSDNGLGINLSLHSNKIFGLYKTFHAHKEAHGVGLFLIKTQVESQGGTIAVESIEGEGTIFKIVFA